MSTFIAGMRLNDRYVLDERISAGEVSQVWRATDEALGAPVAVKVLTGGLAGDPGEHDAAWQKARTAAQLTHPNAAEVLDCGQAPLLSGVSAPFLVTELVEGESLASRLAAGPLPWPEAARIGACVAAALAAAHELDIVHGDIEPGNIMLTAAAPEAEAGGVKVLDFGIEALLDAVDQQAPAGTPSYAAPERLERTPVLPASDVYSLGVLLYDVLTGDPPAGLDSWEAAAAAHRAGGARTVALPELPPEAYELLRACLSPDPAQRPVARLLAGALAGLAGMPDPAASIAPEAPTIEMPLPQGTAATAEPAPVGARVGHHRRPPWRLRRGPRRAVVAGLAAVVLGLGLALAVTQWRTGATDQTGPAAAPDPPAATSAPATPSPAPTTASPAPVEPPRPKPPAPPRPRTAPAVLALAELDQTVRDAHGDGLVDQDAARRLRDRIRDLDHELGKPDRNGQDAKISDKIEALEREIDHLERDGKLTQPLAAELRTQVAEVGSQA